MMFQGQPSIYRIFNFINYARKACLFFIPMTAISYKVIIHHFKYQYL